MSLIVTEEFALGRRLVVQVAENGRTIELDCDGLTLVGAVQQCLESLSGIRCGDQVLLCLDMKLEGQQPLSAYKLPRDDCEVFLYNRPRLLQDSPPPPPEQVDVPSISEPPSPTSSHCPHPLDDLLDPACKALPSYERQFRYHFQLGHAIYSCTENKFQACERLLCEQHAQERAFETARGSMDRYYQVVHQMYLEFMKCYAQQHRYHSNLLFSFEKDMDKLRLCKLHPSLQTESRKCLLDFVKEENLRKCAENCNNSHKQFELKVSQLKAAFMDLRRRVEDLFSSNADSCIRETELAIKDNQRCINEQKIIMQSLSKDVNTVKKLVDDCVSSQLSSPLRPHAAVSALGPMYDVHDKNHLPKMRACDRMISKLVDFCKLKKNEMNLFVHTGMQKVAYIQHLVRDVRLQFPAFKEAMGRQDDLFQPLKLVRGIGPAYRACLAEVVRRKAYIKLYMGMAGQLAEKLATKRDIEVRRREEFLKAQSGYIPRDVLAAMGLFDNPNHCDVNIAPFDANLLDIDITDVERFAPESLLGIFSKSEKPLMRSSSALSSESNNLTETEEHSVVDNEKRDSNDDLEGCGSVEIAGTSKLEVENARLKAELAAAIAHICYFAPDFEYVSLDDNKLDALLKTSAEKTAEALHLKDEYNKHLQSMLKMKHMQCLSYEKRIQELEQRLSHQYDQEQKLLCGKDASGSNLSTVKADDCKSDISADGEAHIPYVSTELMDEVSCSSASLDRKVDRQMAKPREAIDENMSDFSGILNLQAGDSERNSMDSLMLEQNRDDAQLVDEAGKEKTSLDMSPGETASEPILPSTTFDDLVLELKCAIEDKSNECTETEGKLKAALEEASALRRELETSRKLLDESQMNCAHLENCLHEARAEAQTNLCAADRRASEYSALRASAVKMRGLSERFRSCVTAAGGPASFAESLRSLAVSLASSLSDTEDDGTVDFRACIKVLADKVGTLSRHRTELMTLNNRLNKELEEKKELVKNLYAKHQLDKQVNKEKISFGRFELHELAAFILNSAGHYEAINRNCSNYYLSAESVALFTDHLPSRPTYIIGQIVHIEIRAVKPPATLHGERGNQVDSPSLELSSEGSALNPYELPIGCEYYVVTVAMLPDTIHSTTS